MSIGSFDHGDSITQPFSDDVNTFPGRDQVGSEASSHVVDGAPGATASYVRLEGLVKVITVAPNSLRLFWADGVRTRVSISKKVPQELLEVFG